MNEERAQTSNLIEIKVDGQPLSQDTVDLLEEMLVDQHTHLPDMFRLRFFDQDFSLIDGNQFDLAKEISISGYKEQAEQQAITLIDGEITAIEPEFLEGGLAYLIVHGYDKTHRLYRETKTVSHLNKKDSDLANEIASNAGLSQDVETTATVYEHIFQNNQTDMSFLMQRAWRIGYECFVENKKLVFRKAKYGSETAEVTWNEDLISFTPRLSTAEQVSEVIVRGWDPGKQEAIVGKARSGALYAQNGVSEDGGSWDGKFGTGKLVVVDQPVVSQAEADKLAEARLNELSGTYIEAEGDALGRPDIRAGKLIDLKEVGERFSGKYLVTSAMHRFTAKGLRTTFRVRGTRTGLLSDTLNTQEPLDRWPGVVPAIVTNTQDPEDWGRVKVKYPWMSDDSESFWARVVGSGAGPEAGFYLMPDVNDEVMVSFEHGDFNRPVVIGGVWNGKHKIPPDSASGGPDERPLIRSWRSRTGHVIAMYDNADNKIDIITAGGHQILMDDSNKKIAITTTGGLSITLDDNSKLIELKSGGEVSVDSSMGLTIKSGASLDIEASGPVTIKGATVSVQGTAGKVDVN